MRFCTVPRATPSFLAKGGDGCARIAAQKGKEPMIQVVHRWRYLFSQGLVPNSSKSPNAIGDLINGM